MPSRVVGIESRKLTISGGDWLLVKDRLNHGEQQDAFARKYVPNALGGHSVNLRGQDLAKVTAYLLDWTLTGLDEQPLVIRGQPIEVVEAALNSIDPESFAEIFNAIDAHESAMARARAEEKKRSAGASASSATSPSPASAPAPSATETSDS
jgi:hypothetical protein